MSKDIGRRIFLNEILVDYLRNTKEYSDDNIEKNIKKLLELRNKRDAKLLSPSEKRKLNRLEAFFSSTFDISFSSGNLIYQKFLKEYNIAKAAIEFKKRAYDNIINKYIQLTNSSLYDNE